ncbi:MAG: glycosyltransferase family 4 protein [Bacteroidetes bacterium]|nr:glycosyltransferase family 4 protein [Bacteroidota bacterium]MBL0096970.1 glycosyltransferase family 4 protein [Bacteroidota bacterium]
MKQVLIITAHRKDRAPNQRFRFEQYIDFLEQNGFHCHFSHLISEEDDKVLYRPGHYFLKATIALKAAMKRVRDVISRNKFDLIFICREGFLTGTTIFEEMLHKSHAPIIYDFDDAIWHFDVSDANKKFGWMKNPGKTAKLISMADLVFAGNEYLADYARHHNDHVVIIPTTIDTDEYLPVPFRDKFPICIGWSGSITTIRHFEMAVPVLKAIKAKYGDRVTFKVIGDGNYQMKELGIVGIPWKKDTELQELSEIDIGIMPLPDDEWAKGKCGLKGLQYMALSIATVMSPVGVNTEIIRDEENGMLAATTSEWIEKLSALIDNPSLRRLCAENGRKTVEKEYSVKALQPAYLKYFRDLTEQKKH